MNEIKITHETLSGWAGASTKEEGRTQLTKEFKASMRSALAKATGEDEAAFDFRSLNSSAQTTRASSESMGARSSIGREHKPWVFLGRVSEKESQIADTMRDRLGKVCSVAVFFSKSMEWRPYAVQYHPDYKLLSDKLCAAFDMDPAEALPFTDVVSADDAEVSSSAQNIESEDIFLDEADLEDILRNLTRKRSVILTGPPGSGKTFIAERLAARVMGNAAKATLTKIQFHPSYSYEDFVRGWRPSKEGFSVVDGTLVRIATDAADDPESLHVLLIDEINRANVTKVFGELLSLVEVTKRGPKHALTLSYGRGDAGEGESDESFYLPENVYIIGTMNTADRSIAMVDYALRRRFSFFYVKPAFESVKFQTLLVASGLPETFVVALEKLMTELNHAIVGSGALGQGYEIGHSYFVPRSTVEDPAQWFGDIVETELAPLFSEYWFEDEAVAVDWSTRLRKLAHLLQPASPQPTEDQAEIIPAGLADTPSRE